MDAKVSILTNNENHDFDIVAKFSYEAIADNATSSNQVTIGNIPAGGGVQYVVVDEAVALVGASDITVDVGTSGADPDEFIDALDVDGMTVPVYNTGDAFVSTDSNSDTTTAGVKIAGLSAADTPILVEWNGTVASLTAGEVIIGVKLINPRRFATAQN